ncbi:cysteine protease [Anaeramoeba flamelloides]|uniref:Cysteine protease n=1 Tax=Anaeramoeba flamelloides TaxID=1746091 RepID=A0AAV8AJE4_9EUKA|nr:cysteine protease [Anaeramoeba flamelloides]
MKQSFLILLLLLVVGIFSYQPLTSDPEVEFNVFLDKFSKNYETKEELDFRKQIFQQRLNELHEHNSNPKNTWKKAINHFSDLTDEEFNAIYLSKRTILDDERLKPLKQKEIKPLYSYPTSLDNRDTHFVDIKDQGQCGSCWTFSSTTLVESSLYNLNGILVELSEEQVLDCTYKDPGDGYIDNGWDNWDDGCDGGNIYHSLRLNRDYLGAVSMKDYPYVGSDGTCNKGYTKLATIDSSDPITYVNSGTESQIKQALYDYGGLGVSVNANGWNSYDSGVYKSSDCSGNTNHAVALSGYGTKHGENVWILRNSWGTNWGENGYMYLARGISSYDGVTWDDGMCRVRQRHTYLQKPLTTPLEQMDDITGFSCAYVSSTQFTCEWTVTGDDSTYKIYWHADNREETSSQSVSCPASGKCSVTKTVSQAEGTNVAVRNFIETSSYIQYGQMTQWTRVSETGNNLPTYDGGIEDQSAHCDRSFTYTFATGCFSDPDGDTLTYSSTQHDGSALPSWLTFDASGREFSGTPSVSEKDEVYNIRVIAKDSYEAKADTYFKLSVSEKNNNAPTYDGGIQDQNAACDQSFAYTFKDDCFSDQDGDTLTYSSTQNDGSALPSWLTFDESDRRFSGTPTESEKDKVYTLKVTAKDSYGGQTSATFKISVNGKTNNPPTYEGCLEEKIAVVNRTFTYVLEDDCFDDEEDDELSYTSTLDDGTDLPEWLIFLSSEKTFNGTAPDEELNNDYSIQVHAQDSAGETVDGKFKLKIRLTDTSSTSDSSFTKPLFLTLFILLLLTWF